MQITKQKNEHKRQVILNVSIIGIIFISIGLILMGKNLGYINSYLFNILISWPMLLITLGIWFILNKNYFLGTILSATGTFFLIPRIIDSGQEWLSTYWPFSLIFTGVLLIVYLIIPKKIRYKRSDYPVDTDYSNEDGFIFSENICGSLRKIVIDDVFKGAKIKNTFGGTEIDLRYSNLQPGDTYIDIYSSFGEIEIYVPESWQVTMEMNNSFSGVHDKRCSPYVNTDLNRRLILKGKVSFSGVEIKS